MRGKVAGGRRRGRQFNVRAADDKDLERRGHSDMVQHDEVEEEVDAVVG